MYSFMDLNMVNRPTRPIDVSIRERFEFGVFIDRDGMYYIGWTERERRSA
jgi:hypothetical protein